MTQRYFEVSADWMKACGRGDQPRVFRVKALETNLVGGQGFDAFVTLEDQRGTRSYEWVCAVARGRFVDATRI